MRDGGRMILRENLDLRKKRGRLLVWWKEEGGELGRLKERFSTKKRVPEGFSHYYKFILGSTLGVDSWHRKI